MNLYFRLIRLFILNFLNRQKVDAFTPTEIDFKVWPLDMDINIHMNNARYLSMMDLGRIHHMCRCGLMRKIIKYKWMPVVGKIEIRYIKPIDAFQKYTLRTEILGHDSKYFDMKQTFIIDEHPVAVAHVKGLFLSHKGKKISPEDVIGILNDKK
tara:strand:+ start:69192 stop:69653 length:462 start_codon:yes stop_codon:yes gene_type:complete